MYKFYGFFAEIENGCKFRHATSRFPHTIYSIEFIMSNTKTKTISADSIIFDLDGTLWDASASCTIAWNEALKQSGYENHIVNQEMVRSFSGLKIENIFRRHFEFIPEEKYEDLLDVYKKREAIIIRSRGGTLYPNVKPTLVQLQTKFKLFIVSNCLAGYIENFLHFNQLQNVFSDFECSGNTNLSKGENIKLVIERNHLGSPVYVGDTIWDYEASASNRVPFVYAEYGFGKVSNPKFLMNDFEELQFIINSIGS